VSIEIRVPSVGESVTEATVSEWVKKSGEVVHRDDVVLVLETDKASVEVVAEQDGILTTSAKEGDVVKVGAVVGQIKSDGKSAPPPKPEGKPAKKANGSAQPSSAMGASAGGQVLSPAVRRVVSETGVNPQTLTGTGRGGRLTKNDVMQAPVPVAAIAPAQSQSRELPPLPVRREMKDEVERIPMSTIRRRIAERLVEAQHTAAILTTFNEIDMSNVMALRNRYKDEFKKKYDISLGFMGFFVKATIEALKAFPKVNASIEGQDIVYHNFHSIGIAVGTEKGLLVPVLRYADQMSLAEIELSIKHYALKARDGKITVDDLSGGTFTISNGGVYGSLMSTPILNPPQSGILGMHKIEDRPVAVNGQVVVRPMMYVALSYDHRIIDGSESVSFLVRVKECIEDPSRILLEI